MCHWVKIQSWVSLNTIASTINFSLPSFVTCIGVLFMQTASCVTDIVFYGCAAYHLRRQSLTLGIESFFAVLLPILPKTFVWSTNISWRSWTTFESFPQLINNVMYFIYAISIFRCIFFWCRLASTGLSRFLRNYKRRLRSARVDSGKLISRCYVLQTAMRRWICKHSIWRRRCWHRFGSFEGPRTRWLRRDGPAFSVVFLLVEVVFI